MEIKVFCGKKVTRAYAITYDEALKTVRAVYADTGEFISCGNLINLHGCVPEVCAGVAAHIREGLGNELWDGSKLSHAGMIHVLAALVKNKC
jgi:hypothetical protein